MQTINAQCIVMDNVLKNLVLRIVMKPIANMVPDILQMDVAELVFTVKHVRLLPMKQDANTVQNLVQMVVVAQELVVLPNQLVHQVQVTIVLFIKHVMAIVVLMEQLNLVIHAAAEVGVTAAHHILTKQDVNTERQAVLMDVVVQELAVNLRLVHLPLVLVIR